MVTIARLCSVRGKAGSVLDVYLTAVNSVQKMNGFWIRLTSTPGYIWTSSPKVLQLIWDKLPHWAFQKDFWACVNAGGGLVTYADVNYRLYVSVFCICNNMRLVALYKRYMPLPLPVVCG